MDGRRQSRVVRGDEFFQGRCFRANFDYFLLSIFSDCLSVVQLIHQSYVFILLSCKSCIITLFCLKLESILCWTRREPSRFTFDDLPVQIKENLQSIEKQDFQSFQIKKILFRLVSIFSFLFFIFQRVEIFPNSLFVLFDFLNELIFMCFSLFSPIVRRHIQQHVWSNLRHSLQWSIGQLQFDKQKFGRSRCKTFPVDQWQWTIVEQNSFE